MSDAVVGIALGLWGGVIAWGLAQLLFRPRLRASAYLSKEPDSSQPSGFVYRWKLKNASYFRSMTDVRMTPVLLYRYSVGGAGGKRWLRITLGSALPGVDSIAPRAHVIARIATGDLLPATVEGLATKGYAVAAAPNRALEDLLDLPEAYVVMRVLVNEGWTGGQYSIESARITTADIGPDPFVLRRTKIDRWVSSVVSRRVELLDRWHRGRLVTRLHPELGRNLSPAKTGPSPDATNRSADEGSD